MASIAHGRRRSSRRPEYWPAFVDVLSNLLLVFIFLVSIFALFQFFLSQELTGRDTMLQQLRSKIAELTDLLALERTTAQEDKNTVAALQANLAQLEQERDRLLAAGGSGAPPIEISEELASQKKISDEALAQVELLNQQIAALRRQIAALEDALDASEQRDRESQAKIADLGNRLNVALAQRVLELQRYRSDFFGRLREIIGNRPGIQIVGDRFVFQAEVLFPSGSEIINPSGREELSKLASAILELQGEIPPEIQWVLRVDGHTDVRPMTSGRFPSNWELSSARAISVVRYLIDRGVPPNRLVAAGFGEFQPLEAGDTEEIWARNRRIELKLTER
jgi:chemotaxis protein MotB